MLLKKVFLTFSSQIFILFLTFLTSIIVAREMGPSKLGVVVFAGSITSVLGALIYLGFNQAHSKRVSEGKDIRICISTYQTIQIFLTFVVITSSFLFIYAFTEFDSLTKSLIYIFLFALAFESINQIAIVTFQATLEVKKSEFLKIVRKMIYSILAIVVCYTNRSVISLGAATLIAVCIQFIFGFYLLKKKYSWKSPSMDLAYSYKSFAFPLALIGGLQILSSNLDKLMLGYFYSYNDLGLFSLPQNLLLGLGLLSISVTSVIFPKISEYHANRDISAIKELIFKSERYLAIFSFPFIVVMFVFAESIVTILFTDKFSGSAPIFQILLVVLFMNFMNRPYTVMITGMDKPQNLAKLSAFHIFLMSFLNLIFIPDEINGIKFLGYGAIGAAMSTAISWSLQFPIYRYWSYKYLGSFINPGILSPFILALIFVIGLMTINFQPSDLIELLVSGTIVFSSYFLVLLFGRILSKEDLDFFKKLFFTDKSDY